MDPFDLRKWKGFVQAGGDPSIPAIVDQVSIDSRRIFSKNSIFIALQGKMLDGQQFVSQAAQSGARYAIVKKDFSSSSTQTENPIQLLKVDDPLQALQEIAASYRQEMSVTMIGITGSYGKTMLKDLLYEIVRTTKEATASPESFNSQIGVPLTLLQISKQHEVAVVEAGISQEGEMEKLAKIIQPNYVVLTNIGDAHLTSLGTREVVANEKSKLFTQCESTKNVIYPNHPIIQHALKTTQAKSYCWNEKQDFFPHAFALPENNSSFLSYQIDFPDRTIYQGKIHSGFSYFIDLLNMAIKASWLLGLRKESICHVLENYKLEPMRSEMWKSPLGTTFINDTYCSDPQSIDIALKNLHQASNGLGRKFFAFGGMRNQGNQIINDYRRIGKAIAQAKIDFLVLFGKKDYNSLIEEITQQNSPMKLIVCNEYDEALNQLKNQLQHDDVVLIKGDKKESLDVLEAQFDDSIYNNQCLIHLTAIRSNIERIRKKLPGGCRIMCIVKALAYGTNDIRMSKFLKTCDIDILGVSYVDEGIALKRAGVLQKIFVINAAIYETVKVVKWDLEVGVSDVEMITALQNEAQKKSKIIQVHLHVDTGMRRFGCLPQEALALAKQIKASPNLNLEGIMTHFAVSDDPTQDDFTLQQTAIFDQVIEELAKNNINPKWHHAANSSAVMRFDFAQYNMVRLGISLYGLSPSEDVKRAFELQPALSLHSHIAGINKCKTGDTVSYGRTYVAKNDQRIAVLPIGYYDGLHRNYSGKSEVIIRGKRAPMVGKICMDFMMVDVTHIPEARVGDTVLIFGVDEYGNYISPEELADRGSSIAHELITCLGPRIQRIFIDE